ncbi:MAG: DUF4097 family beta strand repeat-containing protein [Chloroflexota bacterium]
MTTEMIEQSFGVTGPACLQVNNVSGSVVVQPGEPGLIQITAAKHTHTGDAQRTQVEISQAADGSVSAVTRFNSDNVLGWLFGCHPCDVDYAIKVPADCEVRIKGVSSGAMLSGLNGACDVRSVSGEVTLVGIAGPISLDSVSGDIAGQQLDGALSVKTVSGAVCLRESNFPEASINTVSGEILLETPLGAGPYQLHTVSGSVHLVVPAGTGCVIDLYSVSGQVSSDLPVNMLDRRVGNCRAEVQGGGAHIRMKSVSGSLWLEAVDKTALPASAAAVPSRRDLLDRLEKGDLTVEETLSALQE